MLEGHEFLENFFRDGLARLIMLGQAVEGGLGREGGRERGRGGEDQH